MPMIVMTTNSSTRVNACNERFMLGPHESSLLASIKAQPEQPKDRQDDRRGLGTASAGRITLLMVQGDIS